MAARKRTKAQREDDLRRIGERLLRGSSQRDLAKQFRLAPSQIHYDVKEIFRRWREDTALDIDTHRARELRKLDCIEAEAWKRLTRSPKNSNYAAGLLGRLVQCCERRAKLIGLDADRKEPFAVPVLPPGDPLHRLSEEHVDEVLESRYRRKFEAELGMTADRLRFIIRKLESEDGKSGDGGSLGASNGEPDGDEQI